MEDSATVTQEFDSATKAWTTVFGVVVMLVIQWPALLVPRLNLHDGYLGWNIVAAVVGLLAPVIWTLDDLRRFRVGKPWLITAVPIVTWVVVSFFLVQR